MISFIVTTALLLVFVVIARALFRRRGNDDRLNLGTVSQQWLLVHKGDER